MEQPQRELIKTLNAKQIRNRRRAQIQSITDRTIKFKLTNVQASMVKGNN